jgi:predicted transcriptional regulator
MKTNSTTITRTLPTPGRNRKLTGVALEPAVIDYLDNLAERMKMNRSFVLNSIVHEYAVMIEKRPIHAEKVIHA